MTRRGLWARLARQRMVVVGGLLVATFACVAMVAAVYTPHNPREVKLTAKNRPPGRHDEALYAFGTDVVGRDILSRTIRFGFNVNMTAEHGELIARAVNKVDAGLAAS